MTETRLVTRSLPCPMSELAALRCIIESGKAAHFTPAMGVQHFEVDLPDDLGHVQVSADPQYLVFWFRERGAALRSQKPMAWVNSPQDQFVSPEFSRNGRVAAAIRELLQQPLWHFVAEQGRRISCVLCGRPLEIPSSRALGYGPVCAEQLGLYWVNS